MGGAKFPRKGESVGERYTLKEKICAGGGGEVWIAREKSGKKTKSKLIALKLLKWSPLKDKKTVANRFKDEFTILKQLDHANIAQIYDFGYDSDFDRYYFTQELIQGDDLRKYQLADVGLLENMLKQCLESLEYLRRRGIFHFDIKPQNILIRNKKDPQVALIDFGLATFHPPDKPGGTPSYMPPEIAVKRLYGDSDGEEKAIVPSHCHFPEPDHKSDLYSLGVTFYLCLTGTNPFRVRSASGMLDLQATMKSHINMRPLPPSYLRPDIPSYLDRIIMKMLERDPTKRYKTAGAILDSLNLRGKKESKSTWRDISSYIPERGKLIDRYDEFKTVDSICKKIKNHESNFEAVAILGYSGLGKSRMISAIHPLAQRNELDVIRWTDDDAFKLQLSKPTAFLIDDIESIDPDSKRWKDFVHKLRWQSRKTLQNSSDKTQDDKGAPIALFFSMTASSHGTEHNLIKYSLDTLNPQILDLKPFTVENLSEYLNIITGESPSLPALSCLISATGGHPRIVATLLKTIAEQHSLPLNRALEDLFSYLHYLPYSDSLSKDLSYFLPQNLNDEQKKWINYASCLRRAPDENEIRKLNLLVHGRPPNFEKIPLMFYILWERNLNSQLKQKIHEDLADILDDSFERNEHLAEANTIESRESLFRLLSLSSRFYLEETSDHEMKIKSPEVEMHKRTIPHIAKIYYTKKLLKYKLSLEEKYRVENVLVDAYIALENYSPAEAILKKWQKLKRRSAKTQKKKKRRTIIINKIGINELSDILAVHIKLSGIYRSAMILLKRRHFDRSRTMLKNGLKIIDKYPASCFPNFQRSRIRPEHDIYQSKEEWIAMYKNGIASAQMRQGKLESAVKLFEETLQFKNINNELAETYLLMNKPKNAVDILYTQIENANPYEYSHLYILLGDAYRKLGLDIERTKEAYDNALHYAKLGGYWNDEITIYQRLGNLFLQNQKMHEAISHFEKGLALAKQLSNDVSAVELMTGLGQAYHDLGKLEESVEQLESAWDFSHRRRGKKATYLRKWWPQMLILLADDYLNIGDLKQAIERLEIAKQYDKKENLSLPIRYSIYGTLVEIELKKGNPHNAKKYIPMLKDMAKKSAVISKHLRNLESQITSALTSPSQH